MAKKEKNPESERTPKVWREAELIKAFKLKRIVGQNTPLMEEWLDVKTPEFNVGEQYNFDKTFSKAQQNIIGWNEEDLKIKFIGLVLELGHITDKGGVIGYFDKIITATVDDIKLIVKSDFMLAKGLLDVYETPYFHFQDLLQFLIRFG
jgi:hypothetical protein